MGKLQEAQKSYIDTGFSGISMVFELYDPIGKKNMIARGTGISWSENYVTHDVAEWGENAITEIVQGVMGVGQLQIQSLLFFHLNDTMPTAQSLLNFRELTAKEFIKPDYTTGAGDSASLAGKVVNYFEGIHFTGQSGSWNPQSLAMRNITLKYRRRYNSYEYYSLFKDGGKDEKRDAILFGNPKDVERARAYDNRIVRRNGTNDGYQVWTEAQGSTAGFWSDIDMTY